MEKKYLNWVEIDKSNLIHNINLFQNRVRDRIIMIVVKSNAYGHGMIEVSKIAVENGINYLGVNSIEEALVLRKSGIEVNIMVLGFSNHYLLREAIENNIQLTIYDKETLIKLNDLCEVLNESVSINLKVETGLNRQGLTLENHEEFLNILKNFKNIKLVALSTHYANIEDTLDHSYALFQRKKFEKWIDILKKNGFNNLIKHTACSAGAIIFEDTHYDMVRIGISAYGLWSSRETKISALNYELRNFELKPVLRWYSRISQVKMVKSGSFIGYGCSEYATSDMKIAIVAVGYYEGYDRGLSNRGYVFIKNKRAPVVSRICMNMMMVDISHIDDVKCGERVTLLDGNPEIGLSADNLASLAGTINYEIVTRINSSLPRFIK